MANEEGGSMTPVWTTLFTTEADEEAVKAGDTGTDSDGATNGAGG